MSTKFTSIWGYPARIAASGLNILARGHKLLRRCAPTLTGLVICGAFLYGCSTGAGAKPTPMPSLGQDFASWSSQLSLAQAEASKVDKAAVVMWVTSTYESCEPSSSKRDVTEFVFVRPSGARTSVEIVDTKTPSALHVIPEYDSINPPKLQTDLDAYSKAIARVKLSPREACQAALPEIRSHASQDSVVSVTMYLDRYVTAQGSIDTTSSWQVTYSTKEGLNLTLAISPESGQVLSRSMEMSEQIIPSPTPNQTR